MAITLDNTLAAAGFHGSSQTRAFTVGTGSDRMLIVGVSARDQNITSVTYNGASMTPVANALVYSGTNNIRLFYLVAPASGTNNIVTSLAGVGDIYTAAISVTGAGQTGQPDNFDIVSGSVGGGDESISITTVADNTWLVGMFSTSLTAGTGSFTSAGANTTALGAPSEVVMGYTPTAQTPAGSKTITLNSTGSGAYAIMAMSIKPASTAVTVNTSAVGATFSIPAYTVTTVRNVTVTPGLVTASFTTPPASISGDAVVSPSALNAAFSIPPYSVFIADTSVTPDPVTATFIIPAYSVIAIQNVTLTPSPLTATFGVPAPTVSTVRNVTLTPSPMVLTFSILTPRRVGGLWSNQQRSGAAVLTNQARHATSWDNQEKSEL